MDIKESPKVDAMREAIKTLLIQESLDAKLTALTDIQLSFTSGTIFDACEDIRHSLSMGQETVPGGSHEVHDVRDTVVTDGELKDHRISPCADCTKGET